MPNRAGRVVVVIDDDDDWRDLVVQFLSDNGFEVVGFSGGREGLAALRASDRLPAVILLDLEMPGMTGWEFREEQLRDPRLARIPVVVASSAEPGTIEADAHLVKPFDGGELCQVVAAMSLRVEALPPSRSSPTPPPLSQARAAYGR